MIEAMLVPFHKACIGKEEIKEVTKVLESGWLTMGPRTIEFEQKFADYMGCDFAISCNSATAALHMALKAIGLKADDEVILPTTTFIATAEVVTYFNAKPVLCDVQSETHNIDPAKIEALITKKTKAIIPVHFGGFPCDMDAIMKIAKKHKLVVIEDAAHALPASYKKRKIGTISDMTCFSFYATKTLAVGEGGMVTTNNKKFAENIKINRLHGISKDAWNRYSAAGSWYYEVVDNGFKYNTTDISSAIGIVQLQKLEWMRDKRAEVAAKYTKAFNKNPKIQILDPEKLEKNSKSAWHLYVIKVENRNEIIEKLKHEGIHCSVHFIPVHKHPYYKNAYKYKDKNYPIANKIFEQSLSLPIYPDLTDEQIGFVVEKVKEFSNECI